MTLIRARSVLSPVELPKPAPLRGIVTLLSSSSFLCFFLFLVEGSYGLDINPATAVSSRRGTLSSDILLKPPASLDLQNRRHVFKRLLFTNTILVSATGGIPSTSFAADEEESPPAQPDRGGKPFAPLPTLIPAARIYLGVQKVNELAKSLKSDALKSSTTTSTEQEMLQQMLDILNNIKSRAGKDIQKSKTKSSQQSTAQLTTGVSSVNKQQYQKNRQEMSVDQKVQAMLNQADVERQWGILKSQESALQNSNPLRACLSLYTQNLEFGDSYQLTASAEDKKRLIRTNNALPSLAEVIVADLDLRDLYRNEFLTAFDDLQAELEYQLKQKDNRDLSDVLELNERMYASLSNWFNRIAEVDIQAAIQAIQQEER